MSLQEFRITPTEDQLDRLIIYHTAKSLNGSDYNLEQFARKVQSMKRELKTKGSIALDNTSIIRNWIYLEKVSFVLGPDKEPEVPEHYRNNPHSGAGFNA